MFPSNFVIHSLSKGLGTNCKAAAIGRFISPLHQWKASIFSQTHSTGPQTLLSDSDFLLFEWREQRYWQKAVFGDQLNGSSFAIGPQQLQISFQNGTLKDFFVDPLFLALFLALKIGTFLKWHFLKNFFWNVFLLASLFLALFWALEIGTFLEWHFLKNFFWNFFCWFPFFLALFWALKHFFEEHYF